MEKARIRKTMIVLAFYTEGTPYENEAKSWEESYSSCEFFIVRTPSTGSWETNCALKPKILQSALKQLKDDILYVDIDSRLLRPLPPIKHPEVPGLCWWNAYFNNYERELLSGTIYIPNNEAGVTLLDLWVEEQARTPEVWDQKTLQKVVETNKIPHDTLGYEWISVADRIEVENPIIHHTQASRKYKKDIK